MRKGSALLLVVLSCVAPRPASAEGDAQSAFQKALAGLASRESAERLEALDRLEVLIVEHPGAAPRCVVRLKELLKRRGPAERAAAMTVVALIPGKAARELWLERLDPEVDDDPAVLAATVAGARLRRTDPDTQRALVGLARDANAKPARRTLVYEALGHFEGPVPLLMLTRARKDEPWVEAAGRALGLGHRVDDGSLKVLVDLVGHHDAGVRIHAWEGLTRRSGQNLPPDPDAWAAWWAARARPQPAPPGNDDEGADPDTRYAPAKHIHVPTYYDVPIPRPGSRVVFCLDTSQSMYGDGIDKARRYLSQTLKDLPSSHSFDIVAFNEKVFPFAGRPIAAHPVQKYRAITWLYEFEPTSYTNIYDSVETAFQYMGRGTKPATDPVPMLDMIFLLSDGAPNRGRYRNDDLVVKNIGRMSRRDVPVHTIGAGERVKGLLQRIARETGGAFVDAFE